MAALGLLGMALPLVLFSGHAELHDLLRIAVEHGPMLMLLIDLAKALACAVCAEAGWLGEVIFSLCFVGTLTGWAFLRLLRATRRSSTGHGHWQPPTRPGATMQTD